MALSKGKSALSFLPLGSIRFEMLSIGVQEPGNRDRYIEVFG